MLSVPNLAFLNKNFRTRRRFYDNFLTAQNLPSGNCCSVPLTTVPLLNIQKLTTFRLLLQMSFADDEFSVVLDKGTIDAVFTHDSPEVVAQVDRILHEVGRVLRVGGRFVCISLAQQHIASHIVHSFANKYVSNFLSLLV